MNKTRFDNGFGGKELLQNFGEKSERRKSAMASPSGDQGERRTELLLSETKANGELVLIKD